MRVSTQAPSAMDVHCHHLHGLSLIMAFPPILVMGTHKSLLGEPVPLQRLLRQGHNMLGFIFILAHTVTAASGVSSPVMKWAHCAGCQQTWTFQGLRASGSLARLLDCWASGRTGRASRWLLGMGEVKDTKPLGSYCSSYPCWSTLQPATCL